MFSATNQTLLLVFILSVQPCLYLLSLILLLSVFDYLVPDLDKMDIEKDELNQADIAALHHYYSKHISDLPDEQALTELFAQVQLDHTSSFTPRNSLKIHISVPRRI